MSRSPDRRGTMSHAWRALRHRNFKLFFFGQSISLIGTWMTRLATTWLVYRLTHSALLLGVVSFAGQIVAFAAGAVRGRLGGAPQSPQAAGVDASRRCRPVARPGRAHAGARHHPLGNHRAHRFAGLDQCVRHAGAPILPGADGRGSQRPQQRHRHQLLDGKWRAADRPGHRRPGDRRRRRRLVLPDRWRQLLCGDRILAADAHPALGHPPQREQHARTDARRVGLRPHISAHPHHPSALCAYQPDGLPLRRAAADLRRPGAARRRDYARLADGSFGNRRAYVGAFPGGPQVGGRA